LDLRGEWGPISRARIRQGQGEKKRGKGRKALQFLPSSTFLLLGEKKKRKREKRKGKKRY